MKKGLLIALFSFGASMLHAGPVVGSYWFRGNFDLWVDENVTFSKKAKKEFRGKNYERDVDFVITFSPDGTVSDVRVENCPEVHIAESLRQTVMASSPCWEKLYKTPKQPEGKVRYLCRFDKRGKILPPNEMPTWKGLSYGTVINRAFSSAMRMSVHPPRETNTKYSSEPLIISLIVESNGALGSIQIQNPEFQYVQSSLEHVLKSHYPDWEPAKYNGKPVSVRISVSRSRPGSTRRPGAWIGR